MLEQFRLTPVAGRRPHEVSGGQQQRCSIARALVGGPRLLLLDEPARGLDAPLRSDLYAVIRQVRAEFAMPVLLVTHDVDECFELGDQMLVFREGRLAQAGPPRRVMEQPGNVEIARLLGIENILPAEIVALDPGRNTSILRVQYGDLKGPYFPGHLIGDRVHLCLRAEQLRAAPPGDGFPQRENQAAVRLARASERPGGMRLEFEGGLAVAAGRDEYERGKDNKDWLVEFPPHALRVI
jgi:ABC-type sulfate/molybdate transport systems ATPase subunit